MNWNALRDALTRLHEAMPEFHNSSETWSSMRRLPILAAGLPLRPEVERSHLAHVRRNFRMFRPYLVEQAKTRPNVAAALADAERALREIDR